MSISYIKAACNTVLLTSVTDIETRKDMNDALSSLAITHGGQDADVSEMLSHLNTCDTYTVWLSNVVDKVVPFINKNN